MSELLNLKQKNTVEEYCTKFQEVMFKLCSHNPFYDETLFVGHFLKGLKHEIRITVVSQLPETVDRAILLAHVQEDLASQKKPWVARSAVAAVAASKSEVPKEGLKGDFWKERQLKEYRRSNGLYFS